jgi:tetratricopeptide (TPR) repeat protein
MSADVLSQLSAMLDTFTSWYQARTEELPMQSRAVFDALALNWDPMTAASLGEVTGLETTVVSSQLSRLEKAGFVESVALSRRTKGRSGYQVAERFFNIWYLMRNGPRRRQNEIKFLTVFLQSCFNDAERRSMARAALEGDDFRPGYSLAIASSLGRGRLRDQLLMQAQLHLHLMGHTEEYTAVIDDMLREQPIGLQQVRPSNIETVVAFLDKAFAASVDTAALHLQERGARALLLKGLVLKRVSLVQKASDTYDLLIERFGAASESSLYELVTEARMGKAECLERLDRDKESIALYDDIIGGFSRGHSPLLQARVALASLRKAIALSKLKRYDDAITTCDRAWKRVGHLVEPIAREDMATLLVMKAHALSALGRADEAIELYDEIVTRYEGEDGRLRALAVLALLDKAGVVARAYPEQAVDICDGIVSRFGDATNSDVREVVACVLHAKGLILERLRRYAEAESAYRQTVVFDPRYIQAWDALGRLLLDRSGDNAGAREAFAAGIQASSNIEDGSISQRGLAYVRALHDNDKAGAREHIRWAMNWTNISEVERFLLEALSILSGSEPTRWRKAFVQIGKAVESGDAKLWVDHLSELQRLISHVLIHGQGGLLKAWMDEAQYPLKYAPFYHAVVAAMEGEDHLLRINPEVREPAARIHEGIARMIGLYGKKVRREPVR